MKKRRFLRLGATANRGFRELLLTKCPCYRLSCSGTQYVLPGRRPDADKSSLGECNDADNHCRVYLPFAIYHVAYVNIVLMSAMFTQQKTVYPEDDALASLR